MTQSSFKLQQILDTPLNQTHWPHLERIIKQLQAYVAHKSKNRQYINAQKGSDKVSEAYQHIKRRKIHNVSIRLDQTLKDLRQKHQEETKSVEKDWKYKMDQLIAEYKKQQEIKRTRHRQELEKARQQLQLALPTHYTPDHQIVKLRWEEEQLAKQGRFMEAQKIKDKIVDRQRNLESKHHKFRQNNIKQMLDEISAKHQKEFAIIESRRVQKEEQMKKQRKKKLKDLQERQGREVREVKWIFNEQMRTIASH